MTYNKPKLYQGQDLEGIWEVTIKIDGVRAFNTDKGILSRKGKPLYNIPANSLTDYEVYLGDFKSTISAVRSSQKEVEVKQEHLYSLDPLDPRLHYAVCELTPDLVQDMLTDVLSLGYEGLVLRQRDTWYKVKPEETYDVVIIGIQEGTGRNKGRLGALLTTMGKVGTGFTDKDREELYTESVIGETVEVSCMEVTDAGKFRHPRFVRMRWDKNG